jgi:Fungal protein kinase
MARNPSPRPLRRSLRLKSKREGDHLTPGRLHGIETLNPRAQRSSMLAKGVPSTTSTTKGANVSGSAPQASNKSDGPKLTPVRRSRRIRIPQHHSGTQTPTSPPLKAPPSATADKVTRLETPFAVFWDVLLEQSTEHPEVFDVADSIVRTPEFKSHLNAYIDGYDEAKTLEKTVGGKYPERIPKLEPLFMALIQFIVSSAPDHGLKSPYVRDIHYGERDDAEAILTGDVEGRDSQASSDASASSTTPSPEAVPLAIRPHCVGVVRDGSDRIEYTWDKTVLICRVVLSNESGKSPTPVSLTKRKIFSPPSTPKVQDKKHKADLRTSPSPSDPRSKVPTTSQRPGKPTPTSKHMPKSLASLKSKQVQKPNVPLRLKPPPKSPSNPSVQPDSPLSPSHFSAVQPTLEDKELLAQALEVMYAFGNRRHVLGVLVVATTVRFVYYDRAGSIFSSALDLLNDSSKIAAAFIKLSYCTLHQLGFETCLKIAASSPYSFGTFLGCRVHVNDRRFVLEDLIHSTPAIYGRGTVVYAARKFIPSIPSSEPDDIEFPESMVVKLSWHPVMDPSEDEFYKIAAEHGVGGVAKLYSSCVADRLSVGIRGSLVPGGYQDRELRIQIMGPVCIPIWRVKDLSEFKNAFISLVKGKILYCLWPLPP